MRKEHTVRVFSVDHLMLKFCHANIKWDGDGQTDSASLRTLMWRPPALKPCCRVAWHQAMSISDQPKCSKKDTMTPWVCACKFNPKIEILLLWLCTCVQFPATFWMQWCFAVCCFSCSCEVFAGGCFWPCFTCCRFYAIKVWWILCACVRVFLGSFNLIWNLADTDVNIFHKITWNLWPLEPVWPFRTSVQQLYKL